MAACLSLSRSMNPVVDAIPQVPVPAVQIIDLRGMILRSESVGERDALETVARMAQRLGAEYSMLPVVLELGSPELAMGTSSQARRCGPSTVASWRTAGRSDSATSKRRRKRRLSLGSGRPALADDELVTPPT